MHRMIRTFVLATLFALSVASLAQAQETSLGEGVVEHITQVQIGQHHHHRLAAILGDVLVEGIRDQARVVPR